MVENSTAQAVRYKHTPEPSSKMDTQAHLLILQLKTRSDFMSWPVIAEGFFFFFFFGGGGGGGGRVSHQIETICSIRVLHTPITRWTNFCMFPWQADHGAAVIFQQRSWWRHQMEIFSASLALYAGNSPVNSPHKGQWHGALMFSVHKYTNE